MLARAHPARPDKLTKGNSTEHHRHQGRGRDTLVMRTPTVPGAHLTRCRCHSCRSPRCRPPLPPPLLQARTGPQPARAHPLTGRVRNGRARRTRGGPMRVVAVMRVAREGEPERAEQQQWSTGWTREEKKERNWKLGRQASTLSSPLTLRCAMEAVAIAGGPSLPRSSLPFPYSLSLLLLSATVTL